MLMIFRHDPSKSGDQSRASRRWRGLQDVAGSHSGHRPVVGRMGRTDERVSAHSWLFPVLSSDPARIRPPVPQLHRSQEAEDRGRYQEPQLGDENDCSAGHQQRTRVRQHLSEQHRVSRGVEVCCCLYAHLRRLCGGFPATFRPAIPG